MKNCKSVAAVLILMVQLWSMTPVMACGYCPPKTKSPPMVPPKTPVTPPVVPSPVTPMVPPKTPVTPPIVPSPVTPMVPPKTPVTPPIVPSPATPGTCPIDALKLGACLDVLGGLVHLVIGDPSVNKCCPVLQGLLEVEAALCLCTTIKLNLLNLNVAVPLALELLVYCGLNPPPGFTCP